MYDNHSHQMPTTIINVPSKLRNYEDTTELLQSDLHDALHQVPQCCTQRWTLSVINWWQSLVELSWPHLRQSTSCGKIFQSSNFGAKFQREQQQQHPFNSSVRNYPGELVIEKVKPIWTYWSKNSEWRWHQLDYTQVHLAPNTLVIGDNKISSHSAWYKSKDAAHLCKKPVNLLGHFDRNPTCYE